MIYVLLFILFVIDILISRIQVNIYHKVLDWCQTPDPQLIQLTEKFAYGLSTFFSRIPPFIYKAQYLDYDDSLYKKYTIKEKILLNVFKFIEIVKGFIGFRLFYLFLFIWFIFHFYADIINILNGHINNLFRFESFNELINNIIYILLLLIISFICIKIFSYKSPKHYLNKIKLESQKEEYEKLKNKQETLETNLYQIRQDILNNIDIIHRIIHDIDQCLYPNNYITKKLEICNSLKEYKHLSNQNTNIILEVIYKENFSLFFRHNKKVWSILSKLYFSELNIGNKSRNSLLISCNRNEILNIIDKSINDYSGMRNLLIIKLKEGIISSNMIERYLLGLNKNYKKYEKMINKMEILEKVKSEISDLKG